MPRHNVVRKTNKEEESSSSSESDSKEEGTERVDPKEFVNKLSPDVRRRVFALLAVQKDYTAQHNAYLEELRNLEKRYEALYEPLFFRRRNIVQGIEEPTSEEIGKGAKVMEIEEVQEEQQMEEGIKGIPLFWVTALKNNELTEETVTTKDEECLKYLIDITCKNFEDPNKGFTIIFHFAENPFFSNSQLTKTYYLVDEDEIMLERAEGCVIDWKPNKNLTVVMKKKKQRHKTGKNVRTVAKAEPCESFFNFFTPPKIPDDSASDDDEEEELEELIEADYELGCTIKDKIIPKAVDWYTGEAVSTMLMEALGQSEGDDDDEKDAEHVKQKPQKKKVQADSQPPECQQQ